MYDAFLSYNREHDRIVARALKSGLQRLAKPWYRRRAMHVFLDDSSLSASPRLWESVSAALADSRYLILLASRKAAASRGVAIELEDWFKDPARANRLLLVLTDGEIHATREGIDWERTNALPPMLAGRMSVEPLWVDLRGVRDSKSLSPRNPAFQEALSLLAARIHGISPEDLISQDVRQHRLTKVLASVAVGAIAASGALAFWQYRAAVASEKAAVESEKATEEQRKLAVKSLQEKKTTLAEAYVAQGRVALSFGDRDESFEKFAAAHAEDAGVWARENVVDAFGRTGTRVWQTATPFAGFTGDFVPIQEGRAVVGNWGRELRVWETAGGRLLRRVPDVGSDTMSATPDGRLVATIAAKRLRIVDLEHGGRSLVDDPVDSKVVEIDPTGAFVATISAAGDASVRRVGGAVVPLSVPESKSKALGVFFDGTEAVWVVRRDGQVLRLPLDGTSPRVVRDREAGEKPKPVTRVVPPAGGKIGLLRARKLVVVSLLDGSLVRELPEKLEGRRLDLEEARFGPDGTVVWCPEKYRNGIVRVPLPDGPSVVLSCPPMTPLGDDTVERVMPVDAGRALLVLRGRRFPVSDDRGEEELQDFFFGRKRLALVDANTARPVARRAHGYDALPTSIAYSHDGRVLAAGFADGEVALLDPGDGATIARWSAHGQPVVRVAFTVDGKQIVSVARRGGIAVSETSPPTVVRRVTLPDDAVTAVHVLDGGRMLVALSARPEPDEDEAETEDQPVPPPEDADAAAAPSVRSDHYVLRIDLADGRASSRMTGPGFPLSELTASADGEHVYGIAGAFLHRWHVGASGGDPLPANAPGRVLALGSLTHGLTTGPDSDLRVSLDTGEVVVVSQASFSPIARVRPMTMPLRGWYSNPVASFGLVLGGAPAFVWRLTAPEVGEVHVLDPVTSEPRNTWVAHQGGVDAFAVSPDGEELATVGREGRIRVWDLRPQPRRHDLVRVDRRGAEFVAAGPDGRAAVRVVTEWGQRGQPNRYAIVVTDLRTGRSLANLGEAPDERESTVLFSPDGSRAIRFEEAEKDDEPVVRLTVWDLATGVAAAPQDTALRVVPDADAVAFNADGTSFCIAAVDAEDDALVFETATASPRPPVRLRIAPGGPPLLSADGARGFVVDEDGGLRAFGPEGVAERIPGLEVDEIVWSNGGRWCLASLSSRGVAVVDPATARVARTVAETSGVFVQPASDPDEFFTHERNVLSLWSAATGAHLWGTGLRRDVAEWRASRATPTVTILYEATSDPYHLADVLDVSRVRVLALRAEELGQTGLLEFAKRWRRRHLDGSPLETAPDDDGSLPAWLRPLPIAVPSAERAVWESLAALRGAAVAGRTAVSPPGAAGANREAELVRRLSTAEIRQVPLEWRDLAQQLTEIAPSRVDGWAALTRASLEVAKGSGAVDDHDRALAAAQRGYEVAHAGPGAPEWRSLTAQLCAEAFVALGCMAEAVPFYVEATRTLTEAHLANRENLNALTYLYGMLCRYDDAARLAARETEVRNLPANEREQIRINAAAYLGLAKVQRGAPRLPLLCLGGVAAATPAASVGLREFDAILAVEGVEAVDARETAAALNRAVARAAADPSSRAVLRVWRDGHTLDVPVPAGLQGVTYLFAYGPPQLLLAVAKVLPGSQAEAAGIQVGDWLWSIDGRRLVNPVELRRAMTAGETSQRRRIEIRRPLLSPEQGFVPARSEGAAAAGADDPIGWKTESFSREVDSGFLGVVGQQFFVSPPLLRSTAGASPR